MFHISGFENNNLLLQASGKHNPDLEPLANAAISVGFSNTEVKQVHGPLDLKMFIPEDTDFFSYVGPFNTKYCSGNAKYVVYRTPLIVSYKQVRRYVFDRID